MKLSKLRHATATRHLAGATIPRQDTTSFGMRAALKKGGSRYAGEAGEVEGKAARPRLDRPGRKAGGRVCKADGGEAIEPRKRAAGELDEGSQRDYLKRESQSAQGKSDVQKWIGRVGTGVGAASTLAARRFAKIPGAITTALGVGALGRSNYNEDKSKRLSAEAKEFDKADTAERKRGGKVKR